MPEVSVSGGCLCGSVRFTVAGPPLAARVCWCRLCQYLGAGNGMVSVCFHSEALRLEGNPVWHESTADSGNVMRRGFCATCGTPLFSRALARPHLVFIRAGALDDPNVLAPQMTIWTAEAPDWAKFDPDLPQFPGQPPPVG